MPGATRLSGGLGPSPERKYRYDLVAVEKGDLLVNVDAQAPNAVFAEFLRRGGLMDGVIYIKPEFQYGASRMDFYFEREGERHLVEVEGVTLEENGVCRFPDAPTSRGSRHLPGADPGPGGRNSGLDLFCGASDGSSMSRLEPNWCTDPEFSRTLLSGR